MTRPIPEAFATHRDYLSAWESWYRAERLDDHVRLLAISQVECRIGENVARILMGKPAALAKWIKGNALPKRRGRKPKAKPVLDVAKWPNLAAFDKGMRVAA